jgi:hypothetical protein
MMLSGGLEKNYEKVPAENSIGIHVEDTECSLGIEIWFSSFILFCPVAAITAAVCQFKSKNEMTRHIYNFESRK